MLLLLVLKVLSIAALFILVLLGIVQMFRVRPQSVKLLLSGILLKLPLMVLMNTLPVRSPVLALGSDFMDSVILLVVLVSLSIIVFLRIKGLFDSFKRKR